MDAYGLLKEADWIEILCHVPDQTPERMARIGSMILDRYNLKIVPIKNSKELLKRYGYSFFDVIDEAYKPLYNYSPLTEKQKEYYSKMYFPLLNFDFVTLVANEKDELVAVGVCMPNLTPALQKAKGKLFPFGWYHLLKALKAKKMHALDLLLIAVRPDYQNKGLNSLLFIDQIPRYHNYGIKEARVTAVLETNTKNQANFQYVEHEYYKRRRAYIKNL
jgi:GNAT superfamily N-acetyltransferase